MIDSFVPCPICGTKNKREYEMESYWGGRFTCEDYYNCPVCSYFYFQSYCDPVEGVVEGFPSEYTETIVDKHYKIYTKSERREFPI